MIAPSPLPSLERLCQILELNHATGDLIHKKKCGTVEGSIAGNITAQGYVRVKIDGRLYLAHRIVFYMATSINPNGLEIDHIDGDKRNNVPSNLRMATRDQNRQNVGRYKNNTCKARGVYFNKARNAYFCHVQAFGKRKMFGPFQSVEQASSVYEIESKEKFGEFYKEQKQW